MNSGLNRTGVLYLTNKSGGSVAFGDVVILGSATAKAFTTTTEPAFLDSAAGVVLEPAGIANNEQGAIGIGMWVKQMNLDASAALYDFISTSGTAKKGTPHAAPSTAGDFAIALETGSSPSAILLGSFNQGGGGGGGGGDLTFIEEQAPSGTGTVTFSSIAGSYKQLLVEYVARSSKSADYEVMKMQLNGDTTDANYRFVEAFEYGTGTAGGDGGDSPTVDVLPAANAPSNSCSVGIIHIPFYSLTTFNKTAINDSTQRRDASSVQMVKYTHALEWENTAAITRVDFVLASGNFVTGSTFRLYGVN